MKTISQLKKDYTDLEYDGVGIWGRDKEGILQLIEVDQAESLIADYFEGWTMSDNPDNNNPLEELEIAVTGHQYIESVYNGDFSKALQDVL